MIKITVYPHARISDAEVLNRPNTLKEDIKFSYYLKACRDNLCISKFPQYMVDPQGSIKIKKGKGKAIPVKITDIKTFTEWIRTLPPDEYKLRKTQFSVPVMPCATSIAGHKLKYVYDPKNGIDTRTGIIVIDIDKISDKVRLSLIKKLKKETTVKAVQTSLSGRGLAVYHYYDINKWKHDEVYYMLESWYLNKYKIITDACKDVTRFRYPSYDPKLYIRADKNVKQVEGLKRKFETTGDIMVNADKNLATELIELIDFKEETYQTMGSFTSAISVIYRDEPMKAESIITRAHEVIIRSRPGSTSLDDYITRLNNFIAYPDPDRQSNVNNLIMLAKKAAGTAKVNKIVKKSENTRGLKSVDLIKRKYLPKYQDLDKMLEETFVLSDNYYMKFGNSYVQKNISSFRSHCEFFGVRDKSELDAIRTELDYNNHVHVVGAHVGKKIGVTNLGGGIKYLVTNERSDEYGPKKSDKGHRRLKIFIESLLGYENEQIEFFYSWLKVFLTTLEDRTNKVGQGLIILGPAESGKTTLGNILEKMTGHPQANPASWILDSKGFNGEFANAALYVLDDCRPQRGFNHIIIGKAMKHLCFASSIYVNPKHKQSVEMKFPKRFIQFANADVDDLSVVPRRLSTGEDKLSYLWTSVGIMANDDEQKNNEILHGEIPDFVYWLLNEFEIPEHMITKRTGVISYFHPEAIKKLADHLTIEEITCEYIHDFGFNNEQCNEVLNISATKLYENMKKSGNISTTIKNPQHLGTLLSRIINDKKIQSLSKLTITKNARNYDIIKVKSETKHEESTPPESILEELITSRGWASELKRFEKILTIEQQADRGAILHQASLWLL